jgi:hypothetical protein
MREDRSGGHTREDFPDIKPNLEYHIVQQRNQEPYTEPVRK